MATVKVFLNTTQETVTLKEYGGLEIAPGEHTSVTTDYHQPVILANYPGLADVTDKRLVEQEDGSLVIAPAETPTQTETSNEPQV